MNTIFSQNASLAVYNHLTTEAQRAQSNDVSLFILLLSVLCASVVQSPFSPIKLL
jgi:hypothetical protein